MVDFHYDPISQPDGSAQKVWKTLLLHLPGKRVGIGVSYDRFKTALWRGVKLYSIPEQRLKNRVFNKILGLGVFTYKKMLEIIEKEKPDILHFHNRFELVDLLIPKLTYRPKVVAHFHREFNRPVIPKHCDLVIGVSNHLAHYLRSKTDSPVPIVPLPNPLPYDLFQHPRSPFKPIGKVPKLLFAFGDNPKKGFNEVVELLKNPPPFRFELHICGNKRPLPLPSEMGGNRIKIHGFLEREQFYKLLQEVDILLAPTHSEAFGLVLVEALYFGTYVLPSRVGGVVEIFGPDYPFYIFPLTPAQLRAQLVDLIDCYSNSNFTYPNWDKIIDTFSPPTISAQLLNLYRQIG